MKQLKPIILLVVLSFFWVSCFYNHDSQLEQALSFAGENRKELDKVLTHYADQSEKLEAAKFLIRNMPRYYGYSGRQLDSIECVLIKMEEGIPISKEEMSKWQQFSYMSLPKVYDAHVITADYLIENIELAFKVRDKYEWNLNLPFDDFCELILPYRIGNEPLSSWRNLFYDYYGAYLDSVYKGGDVIAACNLINDNLRARLYQWSTHFNIPHQRADFLFEHRVGYCRDVSDFTIYAMRSCGIPVAEDFYIYSPEYQRGHQWNVVRDITGEFIQFDIHDFKAIRGQIQSDGRKKGKVYRSCFGMQPLQIYLNDDNEAMEPFFKNRFKTDVTTNYFRENNIRLSFVENVEEAIYLGVFSPKGWKLIDVAKSKNKEVTFSNIEPNCIFQPVVKKSGKIKEATFPFALIDDVCVQFEPDFEVYEDVVLHRKMPLMPKGKTGFYRYIIGSKIEASANSSFGNSDLLYEFKDTLNYSYYEHVSEKRTQVYNYIRYASAKDKLIELAELSVFDENGEKIKLKRLNDLLPLADVDNITDGVVASYFLSRDTNCIITYQLERPSSISKIAYSPRNDDNFVWPGDEYELFYQNGTAGWVSLGRKTATDRTITFSAPKNALLWLRNLTKGREEQVFVYRNGRQYFAYDIDENFPLD